MRDVHLHEDDVRWTEAPDPVRRSLRLKLLLQDQGGSSPFVFGLAELPEGASLPLHATGQAEVDHILSGCARVRMASTVVDLSEGSCVYHPPGAARSIESAGPEPLRYSYTFATERLGQAIDVRPVAEQGPSDEKTWLTWKETESWVPVEDSKGLRIRIKRLMDRSRLVEVIAGIGELDPGVHYTRHFYDQPEIYYIRGGKGIVYVGDSTHRVRRGSVLYIGGGVVHGADSVGTEPLIIFYVYGCEIAGHESCTCWQDGASEPIRGHPRRWRPRPRGQRTRSTPPSRPSGAALRLDPSQLAGRLLPKGSWVEVRCPYREEDAPSGDVNAMGRMT